MKKWKSGIWILLFFSASVYAQSTPVRLQKKIGDSISAGQQAQAEADAWAGEKEGLLEKIREQKRKKDWLAHQVRKYGVYGEKYSENMEELEKRQRAGEEIRLELEPWLEEVLSRLAESVQKDLPFLREEREKRLAFLRESLNDYRLSLAEKTARIFEALRIETAYGYGTEIREEIIPVREGNLRVRLFRMGRTALYFQTPDGKECGWFNREKHEWEILPEKYNRHIRNAIAVAEKEQVPVLAELPVGSAEK